MARCTGGGRRGLHSRRTSWPGAIDVPIAELGVSFMVQGISYMVLGFSLMAFLYFMLRRTILVDGVCCELDHRVAWDQCRRGPCHDEL